MDLSLTDFGTMACYKFMAVDLTQAVNRIEKDYKYPLTERRDFAEIVVLATSNRIGIDGTSSTVNASTLL
jgi:hypothetical protein